MCKINGACMQAGGIIIEVMAQILQSVYGPLMSKELRLVEQ